MRDKREFAKVHSQLKYNEYLNFNHKQKSPSEVLARISLNSYYHHGINIEFLR